jgi:putative transcriptional regulator
VKYTNVKPNQGKILISEPFLNDPFFKRSVVFLTSHDENGSLGFIINKPAPVNLNQVISSFPVFNSTIHIGGPVMRNNLYFFHTLGDLIEDSLEILDGLFWGGNYDTLKTLIKKGKVKEEEVRFFAGYAGWDPDQLDGELKEKSWIVTNGKKEYVMGKGTEKLWGNILREMGSEFAMLANFPEDPSLN